MYMYNVAYFLLLFTINCYMYNGKQRTNKSSKLVIFIWNCVGWFKYYVTLERGVKLSRALPRASWSLEGSR